MVTPSLKWARVRFLPELHPDLLRRYSTAAIAGRIQYEIDVFRDGEIELWAIRRVSCSSKRLCVAKTLAEAKLVAEVHRAEDVLKHELGISRAEIRAAKVAWPSDRLIALVNADREMIRAEFDRALRASL